MSFGKGQTYGDFSLLNARTEKKTKLSKVAGRGKPCVVCFYEPGSHEAAGAAQRLEEAAMARKDIAFVLVCLGEDVKTAGAFDKSQGLSKVLHVAGKPRSKYKVKYTPHYTVISAKSKIILNSSVAGEDYLAAIDDDNADSDNESDYATDEE